MYAKSSDSNWHITQRWTRCGGRPAAFYAIWGPALSCLCYVARKPTGYMCVCVGVWSNAVTFLKFIFVQRTFPECLTGFGARRCWLPRIAQTYTCLNYNKCSSTSALLLEFLYSLHSYGTLMWTRLYVRAFVIRFRFLCDFGGLTTTTTTAMASFLFSLF